MVRVSFTFVTMVIILTDAGADYCSDHRPMTTPTPGPPLPQLPDQYATVIEANIVGKAMSLTAYEYFDSPGNQALLKINQNNTIHNLLFDYNNDQLFYSSNGACTVSDLKYDDNNILFGKIIKGIPHISTTKGALHFANSTLETYEGTETIRGIKCDKWRSCLYWPDLNSNFTLFYYFSVKNWTDPVNFPQIPVRAMATGIQQQLDGSFKNFTHYYDYVDFKPLLPDDPSLFETPPGTVCLGRKKTKPVPTLPSFYHYRQEIVQDGSNEVVQADVWYDQEYRYIRYDYHLQEETDPLYTTDPITEIHDYNYASKEAMMQYLFKQGVRYVKDQITGACVARQLSNSSFDAGENSTLTYANGSQSYRLHMKDPMQLFYLDKSYTYTGQRMTRGLLCDVYTAIRNDYPAPGFGRVKAIFEYYFLSDGFKEFPDDGSTTPDHVPVYLEVNVPQVGTRISYNFVDFDVEHPDISIFDVSSCFSESSKLQFMVRFPGSYQTGTSSQIKQSAQRLFTDIMGVSPLRVQDVRLDYDNSQIYVSATLIDRSPYSAQFTHLSKKEIEQMDDAVYPFSKAATTEACAQLCVTNKNFTCNSYDFCPLDPQGICRLSKAHIGDGKAKITNSTCDHYSRTVSGPAVQELSITDAYNNLRQAVYSQGMEIDAFINGLKDPKKYVAVDVKITFGWLTPKPVPSLTGQFSYHLEITVPKLRGVFNSHIYYDSDYQLVRYDLVNTQPSPPLFTVDPISTIHDYSSGLSYTYDKKQGNCTIAPITNNSFDVGFDKNPGYVVKMKSPLEIFYLNGTYKYAGQRTIRGMLCDVFEDRRNDFQFGNVPLKTESIFQFYFMSSDWKELSEDDGQTVFSQPIALVISSAAGGYTLTYNFYDFSEQHPDLSNFDIRPCYSGNQQRHFLIKFKGKYHPTLETKLKEFTKAVQQRMSFVTTASFLRFQDPQITYDENSVYYIATMVEQAPYILDFTKRSNNVAVYVADKTIDNINSDMACAALCRNESTFNCMGFDYCPSAKKCQLSRQHVAQSGPSTVASLTCDHYSRTTNNPVPIEPTVDVAFIILKNDVYEMGMNITIHNDDGTNTVYQAVLFDTDITRPDSTATTSVNLQHFIPSISRVVIPNSELQFRGLSVDQCASRCLTEVTLDCQAFDYCFDTGICVLSSLHPDQNISRESVQANCDLYARTYLDSYVPYPGTQLKIPGDTSISDVPTADLCAQRCYKNTAYPCKSFDYCPMSKLCVLRRTHILEVSASAVNNQSGICSHYSRKYIADFDPTYYSLVSNGKSIQFFNVSKDGCAKLCVENSQSDCHSFTFCQTSGICTIYNLNPAQGPTKQKINSTCELYTRKYFPGSINPGNTNTRQQQQQQSSDSSGYTGAAMAGLAIGMLIPGMVIGAALLYFCRTKRLVEEEQMRMGFVNMAHDNDEPFDKIRTPAEDDSGPPHQHSYDEEK